MYFRTLMLMTERAGTTLEAPPPKRIKKSQEILVQLRKLWHLDLV